MDSVENETGTPKPEEKELSKKVADLEKRVSALEASLLQTIKKAKDAGRRGWHAGKHI